MPVISETIAALSPLQRRMAEAWLTRFEENWHDQKLGECMRALPAQSSLRRPLLVAMIERDLSHHWEAGRRVGVEEYLKEYPELGGAEELPVELIAAEYKLHQRHGEADLADFAERFPARIDELYAVLKPSLLGGSDAETPQVEDTAAERRLKLLRTPAEPEAIDPAAERRTRLLRSSQGERPSVSHDTPRPNGVLQAEFTGGQGGDADTFLPPQPEQAEPTRKLDRSPADTLWLDVETIREKRGSLSHLGTHPGQPAPIPPVLGRYQIERQLGGSGLGSIYQAVDTALERRVALKVPFFSGPDAEEQRAQFHHGARLAAGLTHPLLCPVLDVGQAEGFDFLVMPLVQGDSLQELMKQRPIWPVRQAVELVHKLAVAMDAAHRHGVVHRDLKPSNILVAPCEIPVVVGFGQTTTPGHSQRTANAAYVAPEQVSGPESLTGPRSDIYSLGAILYQILTGQLPPVAASTALRLSFRADLDAPLQEICRKAMAADLDQRYPTMREFAAELGLYRQRLRPSETGTRLGLSSNARPAVGAGTLPGEAPPTLGPVGGASTAFVQMQQLRTLSERDQRPTEAAPRPGTQVRTQPWKWLIGGGVGVAVLVAVALSQLGSHQGDANDPPAAPQPAEEPREPKKEAAVKPAPETPEQLVKALKAADAAERQAIVARLQQRPDSVETGEELVKFIVSSEWSDVTAPKGETRDAAIAALLKVDPLKIQVALKRAAKAEDKRVRSWAYREIPRRIDADNDSVLRPVLLTGLRDADPDARTVAVEQLRQLPNSREELVINALVARVADDLWGQAGDPRADGGKKAALEALDELGPRHVESALKQALKSSNPDVRNWAEQQQKARRK